MDICCASAIVVAVVGGAALWLIMRYASVINYAHMDFNEWALLSRAYIDAGKPEVRQPAGGPVYRYWPMSYHRIFRNGIFTDIGHVDTDKGPSTGAGMTGKVRLTLRPGFVPFERIVGVYDIALEERTKKSTGRRTPVVGLQIETVDFRTVIVRMPDFDVAKAKAALMGAMGPRWRLCYRGEETLMGIKVGDNHFRDAHMHRLLRSAPDYALKRRMAMEREGVTV